MNKTFFTAITLFLFALVLSTKAFAVGGGEIATEEIHFEESIVATEQEKQIEQLKFNEIAIESEINEIDESEPTLLGVNTSKNLNLSLGEKWSTNFKMNNWFSDDHNAFNVKVSNVTSGKYKILIKATNGYNYESLEYSKGATVTISNAQSDVTYTVIILSTSTNNLIAKVDITSYIK
ncbi:hypothetical protein [Heliorestis convoluta]|uniref:Uncharacterized protein n=1 Tax=Heliorestis convoluta TaxID=356322 RepID=A0A5Q2N366_9FIRM|nr:hypothetical protein [Heliorestis convoluta]QGG48309.1 hypothetical protein FTV88_2211 [Heliorestis convoluta]